jgi:preprotein translocase subunit SecY
MYQRYGTVLICLIQSFAVTQYAQSISRSVPDVLTIGKLPFTLISMLTVTTVTMFLMWIGEQITKRGIGNGISFIILVGIIARLPQAIVQEYTLTINEPGGLIQFIMEIIFWLVVIAGTILLVQGIRKVPVQYAKRIVGGGNKQYGGGARQYIPLKVNAAGVMPIIFAQAIMFVPLTITPLFYGANQQPEGILASLTGPNAMNGWPYNLLFAITIILFTYFYTAITINPTQMAEDMKRNGGFIPGIKPGKPTAEYIDMIMSRITFPGSLFLAMIAILPAITRQFGVGDQFAQFFGGTSLLILVGVVLDTLQQIESHLLMRHYDGLLKTGRIKGRTATPGAY